MNTANRKPGPWDWLQYSKREWDEMQQAYARKLNSQPDLLEALKFAVHLYETYGLVAGNVEGDPLAPGRWVAQARAAIRKATGEAA